MVLVSSYSNILLRRFNPLTRLLISSILIASAFLVSSIHGIIIVTLIILAIGFIGGIKDKIASILKIAFPMLIIAFILWTFFNKYSLFYAYSNGFSIKFGFYMAIRLLALITAPLIFIATTTPSELVASLESIKLPKTLVFLLALTLRHISGIADEYKAIKEAQISRGLELDKGFLIKRIRNYIPVIIPLLIRSVEIADKVTLAMELKLYGRRVRTKYFKYNYTKLDYIAFSILILMLVLLLFFKFYFGGV